MAVCCILRQIKKVRPKVNRISLLLCAVEAGACLIRLKSSDVHKKKERMYDPDYRKSKQHGKQFHLGCTGDGVHLSESVCILSIRTGFLQIRKFPYAIRTTIGRIFRKRNASDGALTPFQAVCTALAATVGTGNIARRRGRDRDRWTGGGVLDVDFCDPRHVYEVCRGDAGCPLPGSKRKWRAGRRPYVLYQEWPWEKMGVACRTCFPHLACSRCLVPEMRHRSTRSRRRSTRHC